MNNNYELAVYYFPGYHADKRSYHAPLYGPDRTEWDVLRRARPRFDGHRQPLVPAWGYEDESDPSAMAKKIDAAAEHGINCFIFDWYWYDEGPYLQSALENGFLKAPNNEKLKFSLMWANHDLYDLTSVNKDTPPELYARGAVSEAEFIRATDYCIKTYFHHPHYWRVNGGLYFSIYEMMNMIDGFGGIENTARVFAGFRDRVRAAGLGELHLNAISWGLHALPGAKTLENPGERIRQLGFDSSTSYVWIHHIDLKDFPQTGYNWCAQKALEIFCQFRNEFTVPYFPNVTVGWDSSPSTRQDVQFTQGDYPHLAILSGNTPKCFERSLCDIKRFLDEGPDPKILTINAWNEWTEGSYLEPDTVYGFQYLEAIKRVFS